MLYWGLRLKRLVNFRMYYEFKSRNILFRLLKKKTLIFFNKQIRATKLFALKYLPRTVSSGESENAAENFQFAYEYENTLNFRKSFLEISYTYSSNLRMPEIAVTILE